MIGLGLGITSPFVLRSGGTPTLASLFGSTAGFAYSLADIDTLFQDRAGSTPVTAGGQSVGVLLDGARGMELGPDAWSDPANAVGVDWTDNGDGSYTYDGARSPATASRMQCDTTIPSGTFAELTFEVSGYTSGTFTALSAGPGGQVVGGLTGNGAKKFIFPSNNGRFGVDGSLANAGLTISNISVREIPGIPAIAIGDSFRAVYQESPPRLAFDANDDRYPVAYNPPTTGTIAVRMRGGTASRIVLGSQGASDGRCYMALASDGALAGGIGTQATSVIKGTTDMRGVWVNGFLTWDGTTVELWENDTKIYSGAQSGAVNTTIPFMLGALNANGTPTAFWDDDIKKALVIARVLTTAEITNLNNQWSA